MDHDARASAESDPSDELRLLSDNNLQGQPMMVTRIFRVEIDSDLRSEFEQKFNTLSRGMMENACGCTRLSVLKPTKWAPDEYAMISEWENEAALAAFVGENWNTSVIPSEMEKYAKNTPFLTM